MLSRKWRKKSKGCVIKMNKIVELILHVVSFAIGLIILVVLGKAVLMVWKSILIFIAFSLVMGLVVSAVAYKKEEL